MIYNYDNVTANTLNIGSYIIPAYGEVQSNVVIPELEKWIGRGLDKYENAQIKELPLTQNPTTLSIMSNDTYARVTRVGFSDYNDAFTATTPISVPPSTWTILTNDGLGLYTNHNFILPDYPTMWNTTTNRFDFSQLNIGDMIDIRLDILVTTTTPNQTLDIHLTMAYGTAGQYELPMITDQQYKLPGIKGVISTQSLYIGNEDSKLNPAALRIFSDAACTIRVNGWYIRVLKT